MKIFYFVMFLSTWNTMKLHEAQNSWHSDNWIFKFFLLVIVMVASFFIPQLYIQIYGMLLSHYNSIIFSILSNWFGSRQ